MNEDVSKRAISYSGATGLLLSLAQDFLLHEAPLAKEKWAAILVKNTESAGDMPDSLIQFTNQLKQKYNL